MPHPAKEINKCIKEQGLDLTIRDIGARFASKNRKQLKSLWLGLPTERGEDNYAFIYMSKPTIAEVGAKIQQFYQVYIGLSPDFTDNGAMGGLVYPESAVEGDDMVDLYQYEGDEATVLISFGS